MLFQYDNLLVSFIWDFAGFRWLVSIIIKHGHWSYHRRSAGEVPLQVITFSIEPWLMMVLVCWSLTSLCHSNGHIEDIFDFLRTQWSTSNHQRVNTTALQTAQPSGLAGEWWRKLTYKNINNIRYVYLLQRKSTQYRIFVLISACTYTWSVNGNDIQNVLSYHSLLKSLKYIHVYELI